MFMCKLGKRDINAFLLPSKDFYAHVQFLSIICLMHSHVNCSSCSHQSCMTLCNYIYLLYQLKKSVYIHHAHFGQVMSLQATKMACY